MNVIEFSRFQTRQSSRPKAFGMGAGKKLSPLLKVDKASHANDAALWVDLTDLSEDVLFDYLVTFPCMEREGFDCPMEMIDHYLADRMTDAQDRAVEAVLELVSNDSFGFSVVDAFDIWQEEDRLAYAEVLKKYSKSR